MQLDRTHIAIRERGLLEILDLSLQVVRRHAGPLMLALVIGALPMALLNAWLIGDWADVEFTDDRTSLYFWAMLLLVVWQIPLATAPMTCYLGQAMFDEKVKVGQLARGFWHSLPQLILYQVIGRGFFVPMMFTLAIPYAGWPFLNEIILLERNRMRRGRHSRMTTFRRSRMFHSGSTGELFGAWMLGMVVGTVLVLSLWLTIIVVMSVLLGDWASMYVYYLVYLPVAIWFVVGLLAVVRFLSYLDLRIRREGWEVELAMRAEAMRMHEELVA